MPVPTKVLEDGCNVRASAVALPRRIEGSLSDSPATWLSRCNQFPSVLPSRLLWVRYQWRVLARYSQGVYIVSAVQATASSTMASSQR